MKPFLLHRKLCWCSLLFSKPFKDIIIKKTPQYENESQWLLKRPTVHSLIASRELSLSWKRFCLFQVLCQSLTYTTFPTPKKIHKSAQRPPKYKFNKEKWFACFVFQLKVCDFDINITAEPEAQLHECCASSTWAVHLGPHIAICLSLCKIRP